MTTLSFDIYAQNKYSKEFDRLSRQLKSATKDIGGFGDKAAASMARVASKVSNLVTAGTAIHGVGATIASLSGTLGLIPAAAASAGAAFATLKVGTLGFADGLKQFADTSKIQKSAAGVADAAEQSARRIESAQQNLAHAIRSTKDAEETLTRAQRDAKDAQDGLNSAREEAAQHLRDLNSSLANAALDEEAATIAVQRAQERLQQLQQQGGSALDFEEAELGIRQAEQALIDTKDRYADLQKEAAKANKAGVEGSDQVVQAHRAVEDAALGVEHAQQGVADASENVRNAQEELAQAHEDAAKAAAKAGSVLDDNLAKFNALSKNTQDTIRSIFDLKGAWTDVQHTVADNLFAGVGDQVKSLGTAYLPVLKEGLGGIATEFNKGANSLGDFLKQSEQVKTIQTIFGGARDVSGQFAQALKPIVSIFLDIAAVGSQMLPGLTGGFGKAAQGAADFVHQARESGKLREWIQGGLDTLHKLGELVGNIAGIVGAVFSGLNLGGKNFLDTMLSVTGQIKDFLKSFEGQQAIKALGQALAAVSGVVTQVMIEAFKQLAPIIVKLAPGIAELAHQVGSVLVGALKVVGPILQALAGFLSANASWIGLLVIGLYAAIKAFQAVGVALKILSVIASTNPWVFIIAGTIALVALIIAKWDDIAKFLGVVWDGIKTAAAAVWEVIKNVIVDPLVFIAQKIGDFGEWVGSVFSTAWDGLVRITGEAWDHIKSAIIDPIGDVVSWIGDRINDIIGFFADMPRRIGAVLSGIGDAITAGFKVGLNFLIDLLNGLIIGVNFIIAGINDISPFDDIPPIPRIGKLHTGGIVPGIPGTEKLAVLKAGERVFPPDYDWGPPTTRGLGPAVPTQREKPMVVSLVLAGSGGLYDQLHYGVRTGQVQLQVDGKPVKVART